MAYNPAAVSNTAIGFEKPITLQQGRALRDNPLAIAEGAIGAPRVQGRALGGVSLGAVTVTGTGGQGWTDCDGMGLVRIDFTGTQGAAATRGLRARFSNDNGASYGSWQTVGGVSLEAFSGYMRVNLQTGEFEGGGIQVDSSGAFARLGGSGAVTVPSNCNAFQLSWSLSGPNGRFDAYCLGGIE